MPCTDKKDWFLYNSFCLFTVFNIQVTKLRRRELSSLPEETNVGNEGTDLYLYLPVPYGTEGLTMAHLSNMKDTLKV